MSVEERSSLAQQRSAENEAYYCYIERRRWCASLRLLEVLRNPSRQFVIEQAWLSCAATLRCSIRSIFKRRPHQLGDDGSILIGRERHGTLEAIGPGYKHARRAVRVHRDPGFVRFAGTFAASDDGRLDTLAAVTGNASERQDRDRHGP